MNNIRAIGFEIEGGWAGQPLVSPLPVGSLIPDNSINGQTLMNAPPINAVHVGEAVSPILKPNGGEWEKWIMDNWPNAEPSDRTNRTCGFHIHVSTHNLKSYCLLTGKAFLYGARDILHSLGGRLKLPEKHVFWERMTGLNTFCRLDFNTTQQLRLTKLNHHGNRARYGYLNYSYNVHGTVEFRALPTFRDAHVGLRFAQEYLLYVEQYLEANKNVDIRYSASLKG